MISRRPRVVARQVTWPSNDALVAGNGDLLERRVPLPGPPVAGMSAVEAIMAGWWWRAGGYPAGRVFGTVMQTKASVS